jgi:FkbH-like protein
MIGSSNLLAWLPGPPKEFRSLIRAFAAQSNLDAGVLRRLAATAMDINQLTQFSRFVTDREKDIVATGGFLPIRLGLVGSHMLDFVADALPATGLRHGLMISLTRAPYGQVAQALLDPVAGFSPGTLDVVLLALDARALGIHQPRFTDDAAKAAVDAAISQLVTMRDAVRDRIGAVTAFQTLPLPADPLFGSLDARMPGSPRSMIDAFNRSLADIMLSGDIVADVAYAAASVGLVNWFDPRVWHSAKSPFALEATPLYADYVARVLGASRGKSRKCLVLDLDNTLWGGIIGDDGLEGIVLGNGSAAGEAFSAVQAMALELRSRGVVLAICSKNDEGNALQPFREHSEMVLKEEHIACFVANWSDKATNLRQIAKTLNIGTDALVFLDDNPAERAIVRQELPEVAVLEVGNDPGDYPGVVMRSGYFEALSFSSEDRHRADYYRANVERLQSQRSVTNIDEYLISLEMNMYVKPFDAIGRARITQLINKSNQFNLTTRRYNEAQVASAESDPRKFTLQVRLIDKFGDNGMISVVLFDKERETWLCDTWLMSCRVLGRRVEEAVLGVVIEAARAEGATALFGRYIPTAKNSLVANHFAKLNFVCVAANDDGCTEWRLDLAKYHQPSLPLTMRWQE